MYVYLSGWYGTIYSVHQRIHPAPERWALEWIVWYSPPCSRVPDTVRSVPECLVQSTLYQRGWYSPPCTREMSEPRWTSERSSLDVNTVTTGTVFLVTDCVLHLIKMQCVNSLSIWWLSKNSLMTSFEKMSWFEYWKQAFLKVIRVGYKVLYQHCMLLRCVGIVFWMQKIQRKVQTANFTVFTMCSRELPAEKT